MNSRLTALLHRDPRSEEPITIANRKKVAIRADFLFSVSSQWLRGGVGAGEPKLGAARGFECGSNLALRNKSTTVWAWYREVIQRWSGRDPGSALRDNLGAIQVRRCGMIRRWSEAPRDGPIATQVRFYEMIQAGLAR